MPVAPEQERALDPYSDDRFSSTINRISRIVTGGDNCIFYPEHTFQFTIIEHDKIEVSPGLCNKSDVLIHILEPYILDLNDPEYYEDSNSGLDQNGKYYIVVQYSYYRSMPGPKAFLKIVKNVSNYVDYQHRYIFLGVVEIEYSADNYRYEIKRILYEDPEHGLQRVPPRLAPDVLDGGTV